MNGFETTGIYPVDRFKVHLSEDSDSDKPNAVETNLAFIPLMSPVNKKSHHSAIQGEVTTPQTAGVKFVPLQNLPHLSQLLKTPLPISSQSTSKVKTTGRVLTSADSLAELEEKERLKAEKEKQKVERVSAREEKKSGSMQPNN